MVGTRWSWHDSISAVQLTIVLCRKDLTSSTVTSCKKSSVGHSSFENIHGLIHNISETGAADQHGIGSDPWCQWWQETSDDGVLHQLTDMVVCERAWRLVAAVDAAGREWLGRYYYMLSWTVRWNDVFRLKLCSIVVAVVGVQDNGGAATFYPSSDSLAPYRSVTWGKGAKTPVAKSMWRELWFKIVSLSLGPHIFDVEVKGFLALTGLIERPQDVFQGHRF